jgi:hypothetical protein
MDTQFGPHTIDWFASALNTLLVQRKLARPVVRSSGVPSPRRFVMARKKQLLQPTMALATRPRPKTTSERRSSHNGLPPLARKSVALGTYRVGVPRDGHAGPRALVPSRAAARTWYSRQASLARHCLPDSIPAWLYLRRGVAIATLTMFDTRQIRLAVEAYPTRAAKVRYKVEVAGCNNLWAASMHPYIQRLQGTHSLGEKRSS